MKEMERSLGLYSVVAISLSAMLGNGIFILPGLAAGITGGNSVWLAYLLAALSALPAAAAKAEMATAMPTSGGAFIYLDRSFGPLVGTITGVAVWLASLLKASFALIGVGVYMAVLADDVPIKPTALALLLLIILLNCVGVKAVSRAQMFVMAGVLVFLSIMCGLAIYQWDPQHSSLGTAGLLNDGVGGLLAAAGFVIVSFNGVTKIAAIAEEVRNPARVVPLGIFISLGIAASFYALVSTFLAASLTPEQFEGNPRPIYTWAVTVGGEDLGKLAGAFGVIVLASLANTGLLASSRFPFAMSRDKLLPASVQELNPKFNTPVVSIALTGVVMAVAISLLDVAKLAKLASSIVIGLYTINNVAVIVFRESGVGWYRPKFKLPLYPWLPAMGVLSGVLLLLQFGPMAIWGGIIAVVPGALLYVTYARKRVTRRGVVFQRGKREELVRNSPAMSMRPGAEPVAPDSVAASLRSDQLESREETSSDFSSAPTHEVDIEQSLTGKARAVVAMFGDERGPETLVEIGSALSGHGKLPVVHLTEVPEQTILGGVGDAPALLSLRRRLRVMAEEEGTRLEFHSVHSRDIIRTVHSVTSRVQCDFLVMRWRGRSRWALMPYNPLGWLVDHLDCNLALFRDAGVRYIREILVYAEPGPHDALVVGTADDLARRWGARLTLVRPVRKDAEPQKRNAEMAYLKEIAELCEAPTRVALALGNDTVAALTHESSSYDLLVMGSPKAGLVARMRGTTVDRITRKAACSVLLMKTPRVRIHEAFVRKRDPRPTELIHFVNEQAVSARISCSRKEALFEHVAGAFSDLLNVETKEILDALWARERTQNTSVGHGVALPHATLDSVAHTTVGVFTLKEAINYHGPDGQKVDVVFAIMSPPGDRQLHLELLSTIARLALSSSMLEELRKVDSSLRILEVINHCEQSHSPIRSLPESFPPSGEPNE